MSTLRTYSFIDKSGDKVTVTAAAVVFEPHHVVFYDELGRIVRAVIADQVQLMHEVGHDGSFEVD